MSHPSASVRLIFLVLTAPTIAPACGDDSTLNGQSSEPSSSSSNSTASESISEDGSTVTSAADTTSFSGTTLGTSTSSDEEGSADDVSLDLPPGQNCDGYSMVVDNVIADDNDEVASLVGVTCIEGDLTIRMEATDLTPLASLEAAGRITIETISLTSVAGLENLREVRNEFSLGPYAPDAGCIGTQVSTLAPLGSIERLGSLLICNNPNLLSVAEFGAALEGDFEGRVSLTALPSLQSLAGFEGLTSIGAGLALVDLPLVQDLQALANLNAVGDVASLSGLGITSMEGLEGLAQTGALLIIGNSQLSTLAGLENLTEVSGDLRIRDNPMLPQAEAEAWAAGVDVGEDVVICNNLDGPLC